MNDELHHVHGGSRDVLVYRARGANDRLSCGQWAVGMIHGDIALV